MSPNAHAFPDANVFLHFAALDGFDWCELCQTDEVIVHITQPLLTELNKIKELGSAKSVRKRAATVQRRLSELLGTYGLAAQLTSKVKIVFEDRSPDLHGYPELNPTISDDVLVAAVLDFSSQAKETAVLVTDDNGLRLVVKAAKWKLTILKPPQSARLSEEPDEDKKEIERLRQKVAKFESAMPAPELLFSNGTRVFKIESPKVDVESAVKAAANKERQKYPRLPQPTDPKPRGRLTLGGLAGMNEGYERAMLNDPAEVKKYNDALEEYFVDFEQAKRANIEIGRRLVRIDLRVENTGMMPARDVLVDMHFPDGLRIIEKGSSEKIFHDLPDAPLLPGHVRGFDNPHSWIKNLPSIMHHNPNAPSLTVQKTNSYEVRWHVPTKLRQGYISEVDPIYILFDANPFAFHIDYSIVADNLTDTVKGQLHVVVP